MALQEALSCYIYRRRAYERQHAYGLSLLSPSAHLVRRTRYRDGE